MHTHNRATNLTYTKSLFHIFLHLFIHRILLAFGEKLTHLGRDRWRAQPSWFTLSPHFCSDMKEILWRNMSAEKIIHERFLCLFYFEECEKCNHAAPLLRTRSANVKTNSLILCICHSLTWVQINFPLTCDSGEDNVSLLLTKHLAIMSYGYQYTRFLHRVDRRYASGMIMSKKEGWLCKYSEGVEVVLPISAV